MKPCKWAALVNVKIELRSSEGKFRDTSAFTASSKEVISLLTGHVTTLNNKLIAESFIANNGVGKHLFQIYINNMHCFNTFKLIRCGYLLTAKVATLEATLTANPIIQ
jgi:hypothetical protein